MNYVKATYLQQKKTIGLVTQRYFCAFNCTVCTLHLFQFQRFSGWTTNEFCFASLWQAEILWAGSKLSTSTIKAMLWSTRVLSLSKKQTLSFLLNWLYVPAECCTAQKTSLFNLYRVFFLCFASLQWAEIKWVGSKLPKSLIKAILWSKKVLSWSKKETLSFLLNWLYVAAECCTARKTSSFYFYRRIFLRFALLHCNEQRYCGWALKPEQNYGSVTKVPK